MMNKFVGIALQGETLKVARLAKVSGEIQIVACDQYPAVSPCEAIFAGAEKDGKIVTTLPLDHLFFRKMTLPLKERSKVLAALPFQLESLLPFPLDSSIVFPQIRPLSEQESLVTIVASTQERLTQHLTYYTTLGLPPDVVSCPQMALFRFARWAFPETPDLVIFHLDTHRIHCLVIQAGEIAIAQSLPIIQEKADLAKEAERLIMFLNQKGGSIESYPWLLLNEQAVDMASIFKTLCQGPMLAVPSRMGSSLESYAIAIGLALDALIWDERSVQFCQGAFTPVQHQKRRQKSALYYAAAWAACALMLCLGNLIVTHKKMHVLSDELLSLRPTLKTKYTATLSIPEIEDELWKWEQSLAKQKSAFSFLPTVPKVSDAMAWLSTHPALINEQGMQREGIEIRSVRYQLVKHPTLSEPSLPYQAQLDIEFTAVSPRLAREFHEALLKGDPLVNSKKEIKWTVQGNHYMTSFELNKTPLP